MGAQRMRLLATGLAFSISVALTGAIAWSQDEAEHSRSPVDTETLQLNWDALRSRGLRLLPVPKQIAFAGEAVPLSGTDQRSLAIVLTGDTAAGQIAADEIISRVQELVPGAEVPILPEARAGDYTVTIETTWPGTFTADDSRPTEARETDQAYGLYPSADGILLSGQGETGMLYAAVTLRWLIERNAEGQVLLHPATVVDWPDYKGRQMGTLLAPYHLAAMGTTPEAHLAQMRPHVDWLFRHKANGVFRHSIGSRKYSSLPDQLAAGEAEMACARAVSDYMSARGMVGMHNGSVALGTAPDDGEREGFDQMMIGRGHYHSWARHDLHRNLARNMARFCSGSGFGQAFIHAVDSGGILDPELWSQRDALTREKYGDDRISADADMFNIYAEEFARVGAEMIFVAYPYSAAYLSPEFVMENVGLPDTEEGRQRAEELVAGTREWMLGINEKLAPGVRMCIREASRPDMFRFYDSYPGRPMWVYWELTHYRNSIYPLLTTNVRSIGSGYSPDRPAEDILWANDIDYLWFNEQLRAAACEWAWNTRFPGWKDYDPAYMRGGEPAVDDQQALEIVAERAATGLWGAQAAPYMQRALATHLSWRAAVDPKLMTQRLPASVFAPLVRKNAQAAEDACAGMDELWQQVQAARAQGYEMMDAYGHSFFVQYYGMTKAAAAYADVHLAELQATEAIRSGDMPGALEEIARGRERLAANRAAWEDTTAELADEPMVIRPEEFRGSVGERLEARLMTPDFAALAARLDELEASSDRLYQEFNVPAWFRDWFTKRGLMVVKATGAIEVDGVLDETDWQNAPPVDQFVSHRQFKVMAVPAEARLLYDSEHLYLGARLAQPLIGEINEPQRPGNSYALTEQVELLLTPGEAGTAGLYQFVVDTAGNLFTMRRPATGPDAGKSEEGWQSGATARVHHEPDGWSLELAIPLSALEGPAAGTWRAVIARGLMTSVEPRAVETWASAFFDGQSYHTTELHSPLTFSSTSPAAGNELPGLHIVNPTMATRTTQRGEGSEITCGLTVETRHPLLAASLRVEVLSADDRVLGQAEVMDGGTIALKYATTAPLSLQLENVHEGVRLRATLRWRTLAGQELSVQRETVLGDVEAAVPAQEMFAEGLLPGTQAVAVPVSVPLRADGQSLLSFERGTVEFWLRPRMDMALPPEQWGESFVYLFHYGPQQAPERTSPGGNSMAITHERKGWISFAFSGPEGDRRLVHARLPNWRAGEWHHIACSWDLDADGQVHMGLYLDGKQSAQNIWGRTGGVEDRTPLAMNEGDWLAQLGGLNSGQRWADADFDELRIWSIPRYSEDFVPERETTLPPAEGLLHFDFEGSLDGRFHTAAGAGTVLASPGAPE